MEELCNFMILNQTNPISIETEVHEVAVSIEAEEDEEKEEVEVAVQAPQLDELLQEVRAFKT